MRRIFVIVSLACICNYIHCANILGVFPVGGQSHWAPYEGVLKALAARGHNVTVITSYPQKTPVPNWRDIDLSSKSPSKSNSLDFDLIKLFDQPLASVGFIMQLCQNYCLTVQDEPKVKELFDEKFDVVLVEIFGADCNVGFAHKLNAPLIGIISSRSTPWSDWRIGNPVNPAFMPTIHANYSYPMTFLERVKNTFHHLFYLGFYTFVSNTGRTEEISNSFFGDVPTVSEMVANTSLLMVNSHFTIETVAPKVPNSIEIGGIHIKKPIPLPEDIEKFMDGAKDGVIFFTLGSLVKVSTLPSEVVNAFRDVFSELPQRVLWKYELQMENVPPNVMISKWFPQNDILAHPNMKLFITHGGHLSTLEAVHYGVPTVGIPLYYDQNLNVKTMVDNGVAVSLGLDELNVDCIRNAVREIIFNKSYYLNMKQLSKRFKDRPLSPEQNAVYWTEYVIRYKGAPHLRSPSLDLPVYKLLFLDVIAAALVGSYILYALCRRLCCGKSIKKEPFKFKRN